MSETWFKELARRLTWATRAFVLPGTQPMIQLDNGITLDLARNKIILEGDFGLHVTGNMDLTADGDINLRSGMALGHQTGQLSLNSALSVFPSDNLTIRGVSVEGPNGNISNSQ